MDPHSKRLEDDLEQRLEQIRVEGLHRTLRTVDSPQGTEIVVDGRRLVNFSSNDYLGLAAHPRLRQAAANAVEEFGAGTGASRLICGSQAPWHTLESALAEFKGSPAALAFSSGYATAVGTIPALVERGDFVVIDRLVHASVVDGAWLSGARLRVFEHNDPSSLERVLRWIESRRHTGRVLVVTESVFSMDGDLAPLREFVEVKERYGGWLMVDEAHATGLFGPRRCGLVDELHLADRVEIQMGTLGKAVGAAGGYIAGSKALVDFLINRARSFLFSTAPVPASAAAAQAGIEIICSKEGAQRCDLLWRRVDTALDLIERCGFPRPASRSPILPLLVGDERQALDLSSRLRELGVFVPAVRYPTVARGQARLRITVSADHTQNQLDRLEDALRKGRNAGMEPRN
jgi:8-amino-7-oxononanoate synthase